MGKIAINESTMTNIANAIRAKNESTDTYKPSEMADAIEAIQGGGIIEPLSITSNGTYNAPDGIDGYNPITVNVPQDGGPPDSAFVIKGDGSYRFYGIGWDWFIEKHGHQIRTENLNNVKGMFNQSYIKEIPFDINLGRDVTYLDSMFGTVRNLIELPIINIPDSPSWNTKSYSSGDYAFTSCSVLRRIRKENIPFIQSLYNTSGPFGSQVFYSCSLLDEICDYAVGSETSNVTNNRFSLFCGHCRRLMNFTFMTDNGIPYVRKWKSQILDMSMNIGWGYGGGSDYGAIPLSKKVTDDTTYQALKNDPDWYSPNVEYSRYNHDSAVNTINSLPDTSAYLASAGGTNTIKFKGEAGTLTDGGAINTLTEEEIAVATAKGWTVTFV